MYLEVEMLQGRVVRHHPLDRAVAVKRTTLSTFGGPAQPGLWTLDISSLGAGKGVGHASQPPAGNSDLVASSLEGVREYRLGKGTLVCAGTLGGQDSNYLHLPWEGILEKPQL